MGRCGFDLCTSEAAKDQISRRFHFVLVARIDQLFLDPYIFAMYPHQYQSYFPWKGMKKLQTLKIMQLNLYFRDMMGKQMKER